MKTISAVSVKAQNVKRLHKPEELFRFSGLSLSVCVAAMSGVVVSAHAAPVTSSVGGFDMATLLARGIIIRPLKSYSLPDLLRVSIGNKQENIAFLSAMADIIARKGAKA